MKHLGISMRRSLSILEQEHLLHRAKTIRFFSKDSANGDEVEKRRTRAVWGIIPEKQWALHRKIIERKNHLGFFFLIFCYNVPVQRHSSVGMKVGKKKFHCPFSSVWCKFWKQEVRRRSAFKFGTLFIGSKNLSQEKNTKNNSWL